MPIYVLRRNTKDLCQVPSQLSQLIAQQIPNFDNKTFEHIHTPLHISVMGSKAQSRGSSPKASARRPKLMRAAATAPSLATSNASRKDLASLQTSRAATLLSRVASYSRAQHEHHGSPGSVYSTPEQRSPESASMEGRKEPFEIATHQCEFICNDVRLGS
jgi:hypothetical protein